MAQFKLVNKKYQIETLEIWSQFHDGSIQIRQGIAKNKQNELGLNSTMAQFKSTFKKNIEKMAKCRSQFHDGSIQIWLSHYVCV